MDTFNPARAGRATYPAAPLWLNLLMHSADAGRILTTVELARPDRDLLHKRAKRPGRGAVGERM